MAVRIGSEYQEEKPTYQNVEDRAPVVVVGMIFISLLPLALFFFGGKLFNHGGGTQINVTTPKS